jgi:membrane protein
MNRQEQVSLGAGVIAAVLALWSGSNAVGALIESFNRAYDVEENRPFL